MIGQGMTNNQPGILIGGKLGIVMLVNTPDWCCFS
jgi:hypothetical protein